ncbi:acylglycerol kinase, mitochondrial [Orussus abietinus]|uniref:acylglycerol kinase, mitochondrial n=1 Tax=Orussus abietinus TaxID=222816 RepID=UPI000626CB96|nr:acylglycerol kinase, mitochondrial [Orussus abietinus]
MGKIIQFLKVIRNNWKKSVIGTVAFSYGVSYGNGRYEIEQLLTQYCEEAIRFGDDSLPSTANPRHVTVILNPAANGRKAKKEFEKYCEPLLHLAGIAVTILQTESEGQARSLIENLNTNTDAIVVAGGDGTLLDVVTGIFRKYEGDVSSVKHCPIGILPLGRKNRTADSLFHGDDDNTKVQEMIEATMSIIKGHTQLVDAVEIQPLEKDLDNPMKPIYAVGAVEWGVWQDATARIDKYWYWGMLRSYVTYVFSGFKENLNWDCSGTLCYTEPCKGCSRCYPDQFSQTGRLGRRWWHAFLKKPETNTDPVIDYSKITNEKCGILHDLQISASEVHFFTRTTTRSKQTDTPAIKVEIGPKDVSYLSFVVEGWRRIKGNKTLISDTFMAKDIELHPKKDPKYPDKEQSFYIDNEEFDLKPIKIRLLPQSVKLFSN